MHMIKKIAITVAVLSLTACASHINQVELNGLHRGMSPNAVSQVISSSPSENLSMRVRGQQVHVQVYGSGSSAYYLAYHHNRLIYWGSPAKFADSGDHLIRAIGRRASADM